MLNQINKDILAAAKSGDIIKKDILRLLKGTLDQSGISPSADDIFATIKKFIKSNKTTLESMELTLPKESWLEDWRNSEAKLLKENQILTDYLPKELDEIKIKELLANIDLKIAKNVGQATGIAMKFFKTEGLTVNPAMVKSVVEAIYA